MLSRSPRKPETSTNELHPSLTLSPQKHSLQSWKSGLQNRNRHRRHTWARYSFVTKLPIDGLFGFPSIVGFNRLDHAAGVFPVTRRCDIVCRYAEPSLIKTSLVAKSGRAFFGWWVLTANFGMAHWEYVSGKSYGSQRATCFRCSSGI